MTVRPRRWRTGEGWVSEREGESGLLMARRFRALWNRLDSEARGSVPTVRAERWRTRNGWETGAEGEEALRLKRAARGVWHRHDRAVRRHRFLRRAARPMLALACVAGCVGWALASSPWSASVTLRHHVAFFNCASARMVGLTPARAGQPGYWDRLDRDEDGVSCEWWAPVDRAPPPPRLR